MSYILDALRRADAERDRGNVPGIHAQPGYAAPLPTSAPPAPKPWLWLASGAAAVLVVGGLAWYGLAPVGRGAVEATPAVNVATAPPATVQPVQPVQPVPPVPQTPAPPVQLPPMPATASTPSAPIKPKAETGPALRKPRTAAPAASGVGTQPPVNGADAKPVATAEKVYALNELPDDIRRQLPNLVVGGSMYSSKPADRLLILNGQVAHEGDRIGNDLVLQQIRLKGALLNFRGYRYTISF